jgi:outer membrane lipopolysaccharide assembly protein LptE/RlpB
MPRGVSHPQWLGYPLRERIRKSLFAGKFRIAIFLTGRGREKNLMFIVKFSLAKQHTGAQNTIDV